MIFPLPCLKSNEWHTFNLFPTFPPSWAPKPDCKAFLRALQRVTACKVEQFGNAEARIHDLVWGASGLVVRVQKVRDLRSTFDFESECWAAGRLLSRPLLLRPVFFLVFRNCLQSQTTPFLLGRGWSSQPLGQLSGSFKWWVNNSTNVSTASLPFGLNIKPWCDLSRLSLLIGLLLEILFSNDSVGGSNGGGGTMVVVIAF